MDESALILNHTALRAFKGAMYNPYSKNVQKYHLKINSFTDSGVTTTHGNQKDWYISCKFIQHLNLVVGIVTPKASVWLTNIDVLLKVSTVKYFFTSPRGGSISLSIDN